MDEVREKMKNFLINSDTSGIELGEFLANRFPTSVAPYLACLPPGRWTRQPVASARKTVLPVLVLLLLLLLALGAPFTTTIGRRVPLLATLFANEDCILTMPSQLQKAFRPPESCGFCRSVHGTVPRLANVSPVEFARDYAYRGGPVIVTDATANWTAVERFDFWFFKRVYETHGDGPKAERCQFFPYQTGLRDIREALSLPEPRVRYEPGTDPWYFGWSNCDPAIVDNVRLPSWQSQLKGAKEWHLAPPPECFYQCDFLSVVVQTGETIVLDTNKWYHKTNVLPGPISITVGAEYD
uniref:Cupin-like domain-containing protein n=1 Tax=Anopheles dirus TaxID=7168 RepID=A0A182NTF7_9DIPT